MEEWQKWNKDITKHPLHTNFQPFKVSKRITYSSGKIIPDWFKPELKDKNTLLRHIFFRKFKNMNTFIAVLGAVRSGKSYFCLRYAELYDPDFDVKKQCSFTLLPFLKWSQVAFGSVFIVDELQISSDARQWWSLQNRVLNQFCDIQGLRKNLLLLPFPHLNYIDKHLRPLINYIVITTNQGRVKWYKMISNHIKTKYRPLYVGSIRFHKPAKENIEIYETMKKEFTDKHLKESIIKIENYETPDERELLKAEYYKLRNERIKAEIEYRKNRL